MSKKPLYRVTGDEARVVGLWLSRPNTAADQVQTMLKHGVEIMFDVNKNINELDCKTTLARIV